MKDAPPDRRGDASPPDRRLLLRAFGGAMCLAGGAAFSASARASGVRLETVELSANTIRVFANLLDRLGYLKEFGLDRSSVVVSDGSKVLASLVSGGSEACTQAGFAQMLAAAAAGADIKVLAGAALLPQVAIYSNRPEIVTVADLVGRSVGVGAPGTLLHGLVVAICRKKKVDYTKIDFVNVGSSTDVFRAVAGGRVDAGPGDLAFFDKQADYKVHALLDGVLWKELPEYTNQVSIAGIPAIAHKRDGLVRLLAAYARLYRFLQSPESEAVFTRAFAEATGGGEAEAKTQWRFYQTYRPFAETLELSEDRVHYMQDLNVSLGVQKAILPYERLVDASLARDALALIR